KASGFERLGPVDESLRPDDLAVAEPHDAVKGHLNRDAASDPDSDRSCIDNDYVVASRDTLWLEPESLSPCLLQLREPHPNPRMAMKDAGVGSVTEVVELDLLVVGGDPRFVVASVESVVTGANRLRDRIRHRPPSLPTSAHH